MKMEEYILWEEILNEINSSKRKIEIFSGDENIGREELQRMELDSKSELGVVVMYTSGICIDDWVRIIGQNCTDRKGFFIYNNLKTEPVLEGMLLVAQDIVGGLFSINIRKFAEGINKVWYFAPDTLEWECLDVDFAEFLVWLVNGNLDGFYSNMRWKNWRELCKNVQFDEVLLIYPFLWSKECDLESASKKIVSFNELAELNFELSQKLI